MAAADVFVDADAHRASIKTNGPTTRLRYDLSTDAFQISRTLLLAAGDAGSTPDDSHSDSPRGG